MWFLTKKDCKSLARKVRFAPRKRFYLLTVLVVIVVLVLIYGSITSSYYCLDAGVEWKVKKFCQRHHQQSTGRMCSDFCRKFWDFRCPDPPLEIHHPNRFQAKRADTTLTLIQAVPNENYEKLFWVDSFYHKEHYPSASEYESIVSRYIQNKYSISVTPERMQSLLRLTAAKEDEVMLQKSMRHSWNLIQNHEYMMMSLFNENELFPYAGDNCAEMFASEYLNAIDFDDDRFYYSNHIPLDRWRYHIKVAVLVLDYVTELDQHEIQMCHVDLTRFGINNNRLKYDDLRFVYPAYTINRKLSSGSYCSRDEHCSFMYCKSECNMKTRRCESRVMNNNVQIVCEKILLGTTRYPGILVTQKTPDRLQMLLERCANPTTERDVSRTNPLGASEELKKKLYNELTSIYEKLALINAP
ncbi:divergent protein kinase domain 1C [Uranotaenia lowii]|uniref:divergent protein kinase domain 1C n=1 Tax=Uranotaenia lowii TaxID=190385 RepID=UPI0024799E5C|nr:divergent protein kinase domain 1C [Uranotaenia lowii]